MAARQHGIVSSGQLAALGYSSATVTRWIQAGRLHRILRGTVAVGHAGITRHGRCLAAVLACGSGAVLSHESSAWLWGLHSGCPSDPHVTVPSRGHRRAGIQIHHSTILEAEDLSKCELIPVTSVARTLLDIAGRRGRGLDSLVEKAERRGLLELAALDSVLKRAGGHPGREPLRQALLMYRDPVFSRARGERLLRALAKTAGLPPPAVNFFVAGHEVDAYWPDLAFGIEVDGWDTHRTRAAFESDPLRIEELKLAGIDVTRITARRIEREPEVVARRVQTLFHRRQHELRSRAAQPRS